MGAVGFGHQQPLAHVCFRVSQRMIVRVLGLFLLLYAAYLGNSFVQVQTFATGLWVLWALICGLGLLLQRKWAAYL